MGSRKQLLFGGQGFGNGVGVMCDHQQQHARGLLGLATALFPIADGGGGEAEAAGECCLSEASFRADMLHVDLFGDVNDEAFGGFTAGEGQGLSSATENSIPRS